MKRKPMVNYFYRSYELNQKPLMYCYTHSSLPQKHKSYIEDLTSCYTKMHNKSCCFYCIPVLQGLMEVRSPYLEELLSLLMTAGTQNGTAGPVATVISLLLQESEERAVKKEVDSNK